MRNIEKDNAITIVDKREFLSDSSVDPPDRNAWEHYIQTEIGIVFYEFMDNGIPLIYNLWVSPSTGEKGMRKL